jgi:hypothetical protein
MKRLRGSARLFSGAVGLTAIFFGANASPALAAPAFDAQLTHQASEVQVVNVRASSGQFRLRFGVGGPGVAETGDLKAEVLNVNTAIAEVQSAINGLFNVNTGGGSVSVRSFEAGLYVVTFDGGPLANTDVPPLTGTQGTTPLAGGLERVSILTAYPAGVSRSDERLNYALRVKNTGPDPTAGATTAEVSLPGGLETAVLSATGTGWSCTSTAAAGVVLARASCTSSQVVGPGNSFNLLTIASKLGADAPGHAVATATVTGGGAVSPGTDTDEFDFLPAKPFGIEAFDTEVDDIAGGDFTQAGGHPFAASLTMSPYTYRTLSGEIEPIEPIKNVITDLPRGFIGNALAVPMLCPTLSDVLVSTCPAGSAVGEINVDVLLNGDVNQIKMTIYAIEPEYGTPVQFAFAELSTLNSTYTLTPRLRADDGYAISLDATPIATAPPLRRVNYATLCGFGAELSGGKFKGCKRATDPSANPTPLITNPTRCTGTPPTTRIQIDSWAHPGDFKSAESVDPMPTNCEAVDFEPKVELTPTNARADSPTGMNVEITMPTEGLEKSQGCHEVQGDESSPPAPCLTQASLDNATVTFPKGMAVNPATASGLEACTLAQLKFHSNDPDQCPEASKVGTVEVDTPIIKETLTGDVYLAAQKDNPFNSTLGLYLVFESKKDGIVVKVAGKLTPDPVTGQLTSVFTENPEYPFSRLSLRFPEGKRAPLINPPRCGTYAIHSEMSPWSALNPANPTPEEIVAADSTYQVTSGPTGGPCPSGALEPKLEAGLQSAVAGSSSPFTMRLSREDGTQRFTGLELTMPSGLVASLKGVPYCPESALAGISKAELSGAGELANPACPAASQVGTVYAAAGAGPFPFFTPGKAYLAGPYKGAPISIVVVTPAVAGPFDLGTVAIRNAAYVDPASAQVTVKSDPIPTILHGLLLDVREIRVNVDRPGFIQAPTNCSPAAVTAKVSGEEGGTASVSDYFQTRGCSPLPFKPSLNLRLFGGTKRGAYPRLRAVLTSRPGDANIAGASVALPHSEFLAQEHIRTICTRVQFAAKQCPAGSIYGHAEAVTPLLDQKLSGPVYLRSSSNPLPDLVVALRGPDAQPIEVVLAGRVDSVNGGIRNSFDVVPDAPVSKFVLSMQGGDKGLLVNSRDLCKSKGKNKATARFSAQNGREATRRPVLKAKCKGGGGKGAKQGKSGKRR